MHPAAIAALTVVGGVTLLRIRAVLIKNKVASTNDPSLRPPPPQDANERSKVQEQVVAAAKALPPPARQFRTGEIIGVDLFANGFEISSMNDVRNPRPGLITGIINMKVANPNPVGFGPGENEKFIQATFADNRYSIPPLLNDDGSIFPLAVLKTAVAANPDPAGGLDGLQGFMPPDKAAAASAALKNGNEFDSGLQAQTNPLSIEQKAVVTTKDPPPSGDLIMRVAPSDGAAQVPGGGADKDGIVIILDPNASTDGVWAKIRWDGGRRPAATGFAKKRFLKNI